MRSISKLIVSLALAAGVAGTAVVGSTQPAQAETFIGAGAGAGFGAGVHIGFGGEYAARYHWYRWHDGYGWHRRWVPIGWVAPVAFAPRPVYFRPAPVWYGAHRDGYRDWHDGRRDWHADHDGHRDFHGDHRG
jgi:hypothetical protein